MKQHITKEQWDELSDVEKFELEIKIRPKSFSSAFIKRTRREKLQSRYIKSWSFDPLSIGRMIQFLGDDLCCMKYGGDDTQWIICGDWIDFMDKELCDGLFTAVKLKLNDKIN